MSAETPDLLARLFGNVRCPRCGRVLELDGQIRPLADVMGQLAKVATDHAGCEPPRRRGQR